MFSRLSRTTVLQVLMNRQKAFDRSPAQRLSEFIVIQVRKKGYVTVVFEQKLTNFDLAAVLTRP
jgi:hypothetical protein